MRDPLAYVRAVHFAATIMVAGGVFFMVAVAEPAFRLGASGTQVAAQVAATVRRRVARMVWIALALAVLSSAAWLVLIAAAMSGEPAAGVFTGGVLWTVLSQTDFGNDWLVRFVIACLLAGRFVAFFTAQRGQSLALKTVTALLAAALVGSLAWSGHGVGGLGSEAVFHLLADVLHLVAAAAWVGALVPLALLLQAAGADPDALAVARAATARFSALGMASVATLLVTGVVNSWYLVGGVAALTGTVYGRLLIAKVVVFLGMVAIAAVNRLYLTPALMRADAAGAARALRHLRRNAAIEAFAGAAVIVIVAKLGTLPPAIHAAHQHPAYTSAVPADAAFQHIHSEQGMADVTIEPGRVGAAHATIRLWTEDFEALEARQVTFTLTPPGAGGKPVTRLAVQDTEGAWQVEGLVLAQPGAWTVEVDAVLEADRRLVLDAPIAIEPKN